MHGLGGGCGLSGCRGGGPRGWGHGGPICDWEALPVCTETVALSVAWAGKLLQAPETCQQGLVAVAFVPVLAIVPEACLEETLLASLPPAAGEACGCDADAVACGLTPILVGGGGDDVAVPVSSPSGPLLLCTCRCRSQPGCWSHRISKINSAVAGLLEPDAFWLYQDWPGLCLLAHKRTEKRMMTWLANRG